MRLIISEKANAAKKIAQFLAEGPVKEGKHRSVPHHTFTWKGEECVSVGLKGHVLNPEYPEEYSNWQKVEPSSLIDAEILKNVSEKGVAEAVRSLSKKADRVVVATDFDREGELIGVEALSLASEANPKLMDHVERSRFSALTKGEVTRAFDELVEVSRDLAAAGEARQDIDLIWGATLTRWVSRATKRYGSAFLSVGRVQSPTLVLIAERERERRAFVPEPYWELEATLKNGEPFVVRHGTARFKEEEAARKAYENIAGTATVTRSSRSPRHASLRRRSTPRASSPRRRRWGTAPRGRRASPRTSTPTATSRTRGRTTPSTRPRSTCARCSGTSRAWRGRGSTRSGC
jgi:DNA topoisomerase-1